MYIIYTYIIYTIYKYLCICVCKNIVISLTPATAIYALCSIFMDILYMITNKIVSFKITLN